MLTAIADNQLLEKKNFLFVAQPICRSELKRFKPWYYALKCLSESAVPAFFTMAATAF